MWINDSVRARRWLCWLAGARPVFACMQALLSLQAQADTVVMEGLGAEGLVERRIRRENMRSKKLPGGFCGPCGLRKRASASGADFRQKLGHKRACKPTAADTLRNKRPMASLHRLVILMLLLSLIHI